MAACAAAKPTPQAPTATSQTQAAYTLFALAALESDTTAKLTIRLAEPLSSAESFLVSAADASAQAGSDYQAFEETVTIAAGSKSVRSRSRRHAQPARHFRPARHLLSCRWWKSTVK